MKSEAQISPISAAQTKVKKSFDGWGELSKYPKTFFQVIFFRGMWSIFPGFSIYNLVNRKIQKIKSPKKDLSTIFNTKKTILKSEAKISPISATETRVKKNPLRAGGSKYTNMIFHAIFPGKECVKLILKEGGKFLVKLLLTK